jgi:transcriptional regulator with GAF, ATPase, and Fis domain
VVTQWQEGASLKEQIDDFTADRILLELIRNDFKRAQTARALGVTREGLYKMIMRLGIDIPPSPHRAWKEVEVEG